LDDYCPRERRVTNHAVVAMIEEDVKQTRCTTCDAEHPYKGGKAPRRRKETASALYKDVLAGMPETDPPAIAAAPTPSSDAANEPAGDEAPADQSIQTADLGDDHNSSTSEAPPTDVEEGPVHRPLIRATLPRVEGQKDARPAPEFTIRQSGTRGTQFRAGAGNSYSKRGGHGHGGNGHRPHGGPRFSGGRPNQGRGRGGGFGGSQPPRHGGGGRKRSR
jgi:hypothetical protein